MLWGTDCLWGRLDPVDITSELGYMPKTCGVNGIL
jgi:hypothetical protein